MTAEYTLHGRPLNVGDKVWSIVERDWRTVVEPDRVAHPNNVSIPHACIWPKEYAWDEPPAVDLASIPPPLCWIEGHPVRKGTAMMLKGNAVIATGITSNMISVEFGDGTRGYSIVDSLTFALPPNSRPMKKVTRTVWINKYPLDGEQSRTWHSEEEAKEYAYRGCQGQQSVTFEVEVPA